MTTSDVQWRELAERLSQNEQRTQALEAMLLHEARQMAPLHETPTPAGVETPRPIGKSRKRSEIIPSAVVASLDDAIWSASPDGMQVYHLAGGVERTFGRTAQEFLERPGLWFDASPEPESLRDAFRQLEVADGFHVEHGIKTRSGVVRWVASRGRLIRSDDGSPLRVDGISTDITVRTRTERTGLTILEAIGPLTGPAFLNAAVEQLAGGLDSRAAVIAVPDPGEPHEARTAAAWIDGRLAEPFEFTAQGRFVRGVLAGTSEFVPTAARDRFPADEFLNRLRAEAAAAVPLVAADGRLLGFVAAIDDRSLRGAPPDARMVLQALAPRIAAELSRCNGEGEAPAEPHRIRELEERLAAAEEQLEESARLETVGRLLAGVAHDFNNLLTLVTGHAELVREHLTPESPLRESVDLIVTSGHSAARVARQLLSYARPPGAAESGALDPNATIRESERLLARLAGERVELDLILAPGVAAIRADRGEFDRIVLNLVANARDAIEETGIVAVRTANATVSADRRGWPAACPPGEYVAVTVTDTGSGMTDDVKDRAFARFFTTKGARGSGLGLATVRDIVQAAGGHVELESSTEWGTSVRVFWPAVADHDEPISLSFEEAMIGASS